MAKNRRGEKALTLTDDDKIVLEAQERFKRCEDWESDFRVQYAEDVKFANGDSDNGWQWPHDLKKSREINMRPALTINKTAGYVNLIVNDMRENKASVMIKPVGEETSFKAAQIWESLTRQIEVTSKAQTVYEESSQSAVEGGIGYWRVTTDYEAEDTFNQDIRIRPLRNQLSAYLDPDIEEFDGSDAKFGFVFSDMPRTEAEKEHPDADFSASNLLGGPTSWVRSDSVRIAEYYRIEPHKDELIHMEDEQGTGATFFRSEVPAKFRKHIEQAEKDGHEVKKRPVMRKKLEWYKIVGNEIVERRVYKYKYVPIVRVVGIERVIEGKLHRRGHVRLLKDPQRMYNYNSSAQVEYGATGTKSPWVGPKKAFEGNEGAWNNANTLNAAYLVYNDWDEDNQRAIPKPERMDPPNVAAAYVEGMKIAEHEMEMASNQYQSNLGAPSNERSGKAIAERQRQGELANYHFIDHQAIAIRYTGMIILDMAPHVYDTERVLQIMGRDGVQSKIHIKPDQSTAVEEMQKDKQIQMEMQDAAQTIEVMFNPKIGKYMVEADIGPAYATQRQEAWNAFVQIVTGAPELIDEIGDLMFRSADFPLADKIAERLTRKIRNEKPYLFDDNAPTPAMQQMQAQIKELSEQTSELLQKLAEYRLKLVGKQEMRDIDAYDAETRRLAAEGNAVSDLLEIGSGADIKKLVKQTIQEMSGGDLDSHISQIGGDGQPQSSEDDPNAPVPGARKAPDGNYYVQHPDTGQHMQVNPLGPNGGIIPTPQ